jgi:hypothetical protein
MGADPHPDPAHFSFSSNSNHPLNSYAQGISQIIIISNT